MSTWKVEIVNSSKWIVNGDKELVLNVENFSDRIINRILKLHQNDCRLARDRGYQDMKEAYKEAREDELKDTTHSN